MSEQLRKSPYKGLFSYTEADKDTFFGRSEATELLYTQTHYNTLVTLYGKSGIGKTSLLQAGLFPIVREDGYTPISVRFKEFMQEVENKEKPLIVHLVSKISEACGKNLTIPTDVNDESALWHFFYSIPLEKELFIVLDQFEETLIENREAAELLLRQINALVDDTRIMPPNFYANNSFKMVIAIREDDLFRLEDSIDRHALKLLKQTRYRLGQLSDDDARSIILDAGEGIFDEENKLLIADKIIEKVKGNDENRELSSAILSLMCDQLYHRYGHDGKRITLKQASEFGHNELEKFYLDATPHFSPEQRREFEHRLITKNGRRKMANKEELNELLNEDLSSLIGGQTGILYQPDKKNVELIHDLLAKVIFESRQKREAEEARLKTEAEAAEAQRKAAAELKKARRRNRLITGSLLILILGIVSTILIFNAFSPIVLDGPIENRRIEPNPFRPYHIPSGVLHLSKNDTIERGAFQGNPDIHTIRIGDSCKIYSDLGYCPNLRHLILEGRVNQSLLSDCSNILNKVEEVTLSEHCQYDHYDIDNFLLYPNIKKINIDPNNPNFKRLSNGIIITKSNQKSSFYDWFLLFVPPGTTGTLYIPAEYRSIDFQGRFFLIYSLKEAEVQNGEILNNIDNRSINKITSKDSIINRLNKSLPHLSHIDFPNATYIGERAFCVCNELTTIDLPKATYIGKMAFCVCNKLTTIDLPKATYIGKSAFWGCDSLTTIDLPKATYIGEWAFGSCDKLSSVDLPNATTIKESAFSNCKALTTINIPNATNIEDFAFQGCLNLRKVILHNDVIIGDSVFWGCNSLQTVVIGNDTIPMKIVNEKYGPITNRVSATYYYSDDDVFLHYFKVRSNVLYTFQPQEITKDFYDRDITLYVPYNQADNYYYLSRHFKEVREMSIASMLYITSAQIFDGLNNFKVHTTLLGLIAIIIVVAFISNKSIRSRWKDAILYLALLLFLTLTGFLTALLCYIYNDIELDFILPCCIITANLIYLIIYRRKYFRYIKRYKKGLILYSVGISLIFVIIIFAFDYLGINSLSVRTTYNYTMLVIVCYIEYISSFVNALISVPLLCIPFIILALPIYHEVQEARKRRSLKKRLS